MKTEQEQIEEMIKILLEASEKCLDTDCNYCDYQYKKDCAQYRKAVTLVKAGYGDVSEYKAEIERLKDDYAKLQEQFAQYQMASDKEIRAQVKQAKIDILNELKTHSYYDDDYMEGYVFVNDIDELIEEVEEQ